MEKVKVKVKERLVQAAERSSAGGCHQTGVGWNARTVRRQASRARSTHRPFRHKAARPNQGSRAGKQETWNRCASNRYAMQ